MNLPNQWVLRERIPGNQNPNRAPAYISIVTTLGAAVTTKSDRVLVRSEGREPGTLTRI